MTPRRAIDQAKDTLINDRELNAILNRTGEVRIPVIDDVTATPLPHDYVPTNGAGLFVTFTLEETGFGKRLIAEFQGYKEFSG